MRPRTVATVLAVASAISLVGVGTSITAARPTGSEIDARQPAAVRRGEPSFPAIGSRAPDLALQPLRSSPPWVGADTVRLADYRGRWVYLDVFGSWCPPCRRKYPTMLEMAEELHRRDAVVLGLLLEDDPADAARWLAEHGGMAYPFLVLDDRTAREWGIVGAPMGFLVDPEGRVGDMCYGCAEGTHSVAEMVARLPSRSGSR